MKRISNLLHWLPAVAACVVAVPSAEALDSETRKQFNFEPPRVIVSEEPARLMLIDGPPAPVPIAGTELEFVIDAPTAQLVSPLAGGEAGRAAGTGRVVRHRCRAAPRHRDGVDSGAAARGPVDAQRRHH